MAYSLKHLTDQELICLFNEGEEHAFSELLSRYKQNVYASIFYMVKDKYIAEDLFQETFLTSIAQLRKHRYQEQGKFLPWILRIAHNLCIDHFRNVKQQVKVTINGGEDLLALIASAELPAEQALVKRQTEDAVRNMLMQLPVEQQEVVILRIYGGLSFKEIASLTGVSINTALGRMRYALTNLRRLIGEKNLVLR